MSNLALGANGQGVCGVLLDFTHDYIENLTITLISPAGQSVRLVGPGSVDPGMIATSGSRWNIEFLPCNVVPNPWPGTGPRFSANNSNWGAFGRFTGSYHPNAGCLSNFNTGAVNGQWCIRIQSNAITPQVRTLRNFQVKFCDESGPGCCTAEEPVFAGPGAPRDTTLCAGDPGLLKTFTFAPAANAIYEQRLVVSRNDTILAYSVADVDLTAARPGTYEICALQYWVDQTSQLPRVGQRAAALPALISRGILCGELAPVCATWRITPRPRTRTVDTLLCQGETLLVGGRTFSSPTVELLTLRSAGGCDSLINLRLRFRAPTFDTLRQDLCNGSFITFDGRRITSAGPYTARLQTRTGCDSTVTLVVTLRQPINQMRSLSLCAGDSVRVASRWVRRDTTIRETLRTRFGCDSVVVTTITVLAPRARITAVDTLLTCTRTSLTLSAQAPVGPAGSTVTVGWEDVTGATLSSTNTLLVTLPGTYYYTATISLAGVGCIARDTQVVRTDTVLPIISIAGASTLTCDSNSRVLRAFQVGFRQNLSYSWSFAGLALGADSVQRASQPGRYLLRAVNLGNGCADTSSVFLDIDTVLPAIDFRAPQTLTCARDSVLLDASASALPGFSVTWLDPAGTALMQRGVGGQAFAREVGDYVLRVRNVGTGCVDSALVSVSAETDALTATVTGRDTLNCFRARVDLIATSSAPANYTWRDTSGQVLSTDAVLTTSQGGRFELTAVDQLTGCRALVAVVIPVDSARPVLSLLDTASLTCVASRLNLRAVVGADSARYDFIWSGPPGGIFRGGSSPTVGVDSVGSYRVSVTNPRNGCTTQDSVWVQDVRTLPSVAAGPDQLIDCTNDRVTLGLPDASGGLIIYQWFGPPGGFAERPDLATVTVTAPGTYILTASDTLSSCSARDSVTVTIDQNVPTIVVADSAWIACGDTAVFLVASTLLEPGRARWRWSGPVVGADSTRASFEATAAGDYRVQLTDTLTNCRAEANITVAERCPLRLNLAARDTLNCRTGPELALSLAPLPLPGARVAWTSRGGFIVSGADGYTPRFRGAGVYLIEIRRSNGGLVLQDSLVVVEDTVAPGADAGSAFELDCATASSCLTLTGSSTTVSSPLSYLWTTEGGRFCADTTALAVRVNAPGLYEFTVTNEVNGCSSTDAVAISVEPGVPIPDAGRDRVLACNGDSLTLTGHPPTNRVGLTWWWADATGSRLTPVGDSLLRVGRAATFAFVARNNANGCEVADSVFVVQRGCSPNAQPSTDGVLDCQNMSVTLSTPEQAGMSYRWEGVDVAFGPVDLREVSVTQPGQYRILVRESSFGLADSALVTVRQDTSAPVAIALAPEALTCVRTSVTLDARSSTASDGGLLQYAWLGGELSPVLDTLPRVSVAAGGSYVLIVRAFGNGCMDSATVTVAVDTSAPQIQVSVDGAFDCATTQVSLDAAASTGIGSLRYAWRALEGQRLLGADLSRVITDAAGPVELRLSDGATGCVAIDTIEVPGATRDFVSAGADVILDCVTSVARLNAMALAGAREVYWTGSPLNCLSDTLSLSPEVSCAGTYTLVWVSADGACRYQDKVVVTAPLGQLGLSVEGDTLLTCNVPQLTLVGRSPSADVTATWSGGGVVADSVLLVDEPGLYVWRGTSATGCPDSVMVRVDVDTLGPVVELVPLDTLTCARDRVTLLVGPLDTARVDVSWTDPRGRRLVGNTPGVSEAGRYTYAVNDRQTGCSTLGEVEIAVDTVRPTLSLSVSGSGRLTCDTPSVRVEALVGGGEGSYRWTGPAGQRFVVGAVQKLALPGRIRVMFTDARTGCVTRDSLTITEDRPPFASYSLVRDTALSCQGELTLNVVLPPTVQARWFDSAGVELVDLRVQTPGFYRLELTQIASGCIRLDSVRVRAYQSPYNVSVAVAAELSCAVEQVLAKAELVGNPPNALEFVWIDPSADTVLRGAKREITIEAAGRWQLAVREIGTTCWQRSEFDVLRDGDGILGLELSVMDAGCPGERGGRIEVLQLEGGSAPFRYQLDATPEQTVGQFGLLEAGEYELLVTDAAGCRFRENVRVGGTALKSVYLPAEVQIALGDSLCLTPELEGVALPDRVFWRALRQNLPCTDCLQLCWAPLENNEVEVMVTVDGCTASARTRVVVIAAEPLVYPNAFSPNGDGVNDTWWLRTAAGARITRATVYDRWGDIVFDVPGNTDGSVGEWDGKSADRELSVGVYVAHVSGVDGRGEPWIRVVDVTLLK